MEVHAGDFFKLVENRHFFQFCGGWKRLFNRIAYCRHIKSNIQLATLYKKSYQNNYPSEMTDMSSRTRNMKMCDVCNRNIRDKS